MRPCLSGELQNRIRTLPTISMNENSHSLGAMEMKTAVMTEILKTMKEHEQGETYDVLVTLFNKIAIL